MDRRPSTQDVSWFLDLDRNGQLELDPPYQRRSVWTPKDRRFFLDTIFRNYPSPAVFLHKHITDEGRITYHVVDGKQRLETILNFSRNKLRIAPDFGDDRLAGKRWSDISSDIELKTRFWNYQVPVEMIDFIDSDIVKNVFDRLNRNSRKLTNQELRHARFDGWFIERAEREADDEIWRELGISTRARRTRMMDVQFISELMAVVLKRQAQGFSQDMLDDIYAEYDELEELDDFDQETFEESMTTAKSMLAAMDQHNGAVSKHAKSAVGPIYTLWSVIALSPDLPDPATVAQRYDSFMKKVAEIDALEPGTPIPEQPGYDIAALYRENARGASTEPAQRQARFEALKQALTSA